VCGGLLILARLLRLGFLGDFLSASVLIGFLTGVRHLGPDRPDPDMLGIRRAPETGSSSSGHAHASDDASLWTVAFAAGTLLIIVGCKLISRKIPGAVIAVISRSCCPTCWTPPVTGWPCIGPVQGGLPPFGLPQGLHLGDIPTVMGSPCHASSDHRQSAATSRSFAMKHSERVDINQDIVGLAGANIAPGLTGTFVRERQPDQDRDPRRAARSQSDGQHHDVDRGDPSWSCSSRGYLTNMPVAVLAAIVFMIGLGLIDIKGLRRLSAARVSEFLIACVTAVVVFAWGVEEGIILAIACR
jgi:MFS superfamily sulfate permease-like transporter